MAQMSPNYTHMMKKLIEAAGDLDLDYWMLVVNSKKGVSNDIKTDGNAFCFRLNRNNLNRLMKGKAPKDSYFGSFEEVVGVM